MPIVISALEGSVPVTSRTHHIKKVETTLDQYLGTCLIQLSTSPYPSPPVVIPKKSGGARIAVNYNKLNQISSLSQLPFFSRGSSNRPPGEGTGVSLFDLVCSFHQTTAQKGTVPPTAFCTYGPLRVARHAPRQQCFARLVH